MNLLEQQVRFLVHDLFRYRYIVVTGFVLINMLMVGLGLSWPKNYTSSTTIFVEEKNIIQPLMEGAAVATTVTDRARIARETIFSRKILGQILEEMKIFDDKTTPVERERLMEGLVGRTAVKNVGPNLIRIEHTDSIPQRAYEVTKRFAELFIAESLGNQSQESQTAYEFIDKQVKEYHDKLTKAEVALKDFRSEHVDARPGTEAEVAGKINALQATIEKTSLDLKETEIKRASIEKQLSGEVEVTASLTREGQFVNRIAELQSQLDLLRLNYHDTYPDIVRVKHQIEDLKEAARSERERREKNRQEGRGANSGSVDESVRINPLYQKLRGELLETNTTIETLKTRLGESQRRLAAELERAKRVHGGEAVLAELTRDYEVNRDIYRDLLRRRENARVSKNLDRDKQGLSLRVQEPAAIPVTPSGLRFLHFTVGGLLLGVLLPPGILFGLQQVNPWVRSPALIHEKLRLPVLVSVPHLATPRENQGALQGFGVIVVVGIVTIGFVLTTAWLKYIAVL